MFFAQAPSAARPVLADAKFNPFSIVKAGLVSEMMDDGMLINDACRKAGMSSTTYRHAMLLGKAQPPKRAIIQRANFSPRTVAKHLELENLLSAGMYMHHAAAAVGASAEAYIVWRLQTDAEAAAQAQTKSSKRYDPVQSTFEEVRNFAAEQRQRMAAKEQPTKASVKEMKFADLDAEGRAFFTRATQDEGSKVVHGDWTGRAKIISSDGSGTDWHITSIKRTDGMLTVKACAQGLKDLAAAKAKGGQAHLDHVLGVITKLFSLCPNLLSEDWKVDQIEGDMSGITVTARRLRKTRGSSTKKSCSSW